MALEQHLPLAPNPNTLVRETDGRTNGVDARPTSIDGGDDGNKAPRLPRWTRQEILVLIQGKRDAESRVRRVRTSGLPFGSGQVEPKWASVSSYCKKHGVNRGPVQCRKRWSNLAGDYKKIKEWESQIREETESFWVMRNDLRRERKLPGFFDKEVYDILDSGSQSPALALALAPGLDTATATVEDVKVGRGIAAEGAEADVEPPLFDSGRSAAAEDGLFSDFEQDEAGGSPEKEAVGNEGPAAASAIPAPVPISEKQYLPLPMRCQGEGITKEKQSSPNPEIGSTSEGLKKRKRFTTDVEEENLQYQLVDILERNGKMLTAQLEAQNTNSQMDREQRKGHADTLVAVLNKLAEALGRIADKL
ncbi:Trihelix transcription factor ASR3 [Quillaja saponaria]|uniref:Trihelix transcription factor ASR3 n=1 Tax=Quillaja saponaria TaxID=32244 RepID=A0AAD7KTM2_QUISA|nr:Trihelix transcription factor ASR3 [Quillaja saponaria]